SPDQILEAILALPPQTKLMLLAPVIRGRRGAHAEAFERIRLARFVRVRINGTLYDLEQAPPLEAGRTHTVEAVVDRLIIREGVRPRAAESLRLALEHGDGAVLVVYQPPDASGPDSPWQERLFSTLFACPNCGLSDDELEPRTFSFNSPYGACPRCEGLGEVEAFDPDLVVPDGTKSLIEGAIAPWKKSGKLDAEKRREWLLSAASALSVAAETQWREWPPAARHKLLWGEPGRSETGLISILEQQWLLAKTAPQKAALAPFRGTIRCPDCRGARLKPQARNVRIDGRAIQELVALRVGDARDFLAQAKFDEIRAEVAAPAVREIVNRLAFLQEVGLDYLTLDRPADTLSGGEAQRIRLAAAIGSGLAGACYVLDEPSIGLHPRDNDRLIASLRTLQQQENTLIVVEHDEALMRAADWLIDVGPGAGRIGGEIVAQGTLDEIAKQPGSVTGPWLSGERRLTDEASHRPLESQNVLVLAGATGHNLQDVTLTIPLGRFVCVSGVSGSGKSTLIVETLARAVRRGLDAGGPKPEPFRELLGVEKIQRLVEVDQTPLGRSNRSNPATYTGAFDEIRKVFAATKTAKLRGYKAARFSFNAAGGRCETCHGNGRQKIEMRILPDLWVVCPTCGGRRFNAATLEVKFKERSIADVLEMRIDEAADFFENVPLLAPLLRTLIDVGLGYLTLGQPGSTLSGGEAQRLTLAAELGRPGLGATLYLLDEPTTGLHFGDVANLLRVLQSLVDRGHTIVCIEHHLGVIRAADWVIDLGPDAGPDGGRIVAAGPPGEVAQNANSVTGRYLRGER
ncbi:MAG TPA: excinuclease ABC subunit UvrA, partial [Pirellulales bacterium]